MKLQHEDKQAPASKVTVHYDGRFEDLKIDENGVVEVENKLQAQELQTSHGKFFPVNKDEENNLPDYVLENKNVSEVERYVRDIDNVERLKELRQLESNGKNRATAIQHIDDRIGEIQAPEQEESAEESFEAEESVDEEADEQEEQDDSNDGGGEEDEVSEEDEEEGEEVDDEEQ